MKKSSFTKNIFKAMFIATLFVGIGGGVAFAILQSQQNLLTGNTISTATANLQISTDNLNFSNSKIGFDFNNIVPGGVAVPVAGHSFQLKNSGGTPLALKFYIKSIPLNPSNIDLNKVNIILTTVGGSVPPQTFTIQSLIDSLSTGGLSISPTNLEVNNSQLFKLQASMNADAISGQSASLSNIDFVFEGQVR